MNSSEQKKVKKELLDKDYSQYYFEQYKLYLAGIEKISDRRENANKYFVTLNSGIIVAVSFLLQYIKDFFFFPAIFAILILGIILSVIFFILINSYKQINSGKFSILHEIEENLPIKMYKDEWIILGEGKDIKIYFPFSHIERVIPIVFFILYLVVLVYFINVFLCY